MTTHSRRRFLQVAAAATFSTLPGVGMAAQIQDGTPADQVAFLKAAAAGDLNAVKQLLAGNASLLNAKDAAGRSAFALALLGRHPDVAGHLKDSGYQCDLHEAALAADWTRFDELTSDLNAATLATVNADHPLGGNAMFAAALGGAGSEIWHIYGACGDPNVSPRGRSGVSALQAALRHPDLPTAEMTAATLLANATDPNPGENAAAPPLHIAAERGSSELVEMLIRLGAKADARNENGQTALQVARAAGNGDVARLLADHNTIPRTHRTHQSLIDADGNKYIPPDISDLSIVERNRFVGQSHGNLEFIKDGVQREPRLAHSVATTSEICVEACAHIGRKPIVEVLLEHGAPYSLPTAVMRGDMTTVRKFLAADPQRIYERGAHDFALLWYPVIGNCPVEMMELLIESGAEVEQQHYLGTTALHWACLRGRVDVVDFLIAKGADVNRVGRKFTADGESPLQSAVATGQDKIVDLLKSKGAVK